MKYGILIAVLACAGVWGVFGYGKRVATNEKYLGAPLVNDKYVADVARLGGGTAFGSWGVMKLVRVGNHDMEFLISKSAYNKS